MKTKETAEELNQKIAKLPVWAQTVIRDVTRQRDNALREQREYLADQKESPFFVEHVGPGNKDTRFVQAHTLTVRWQGVKLRVDANPYGNSGPGIRLQWEADDHKDVALIPSSYQSARLVSKEHMS